MLNEAERLEFEEFLRRSEMRISLEDLPAMEAQYLLVKGYVAVVDGAAADLDAIEPGFLFDPLRGLPA